MLIKKNNQSKRKSWYICDRCGDKLTGFSRNLISVNGKKRFDLCTKCCRIMEKYIERGIKQCQMKKRKQSNI